MLTPTLRAMMLFTLLTLPQAALAGSMTYDLVNYPDLQNGWTLTGTITTDGNIGSISSTDITSWMWTVSMSGDTQTYRSTDPGAVIDLSGFLVANGGGLLMVSTPPSTTTFDLSTDRGDLSYQLMAYPVPAGFGNGGYFITTLAYDSVTGLYWYNYGSGGLIIPPQTNAQLAVATSPVPEPSTLYLLGFGAVCGSVYVMGHNRRER